MRFQLRSRSTSPRVRKKMRSSSTRRCEPWLNRVNSNIKRSRAFSIRVTLHQPETDQYSRERRSIIPRNWRGSRFTPGNLDVSAEMGREMIVVEPWPAVHSSEKEAALRPLKFHGEDSARLLVCSVATIMEPATRKRCALSFVEPFVREHRSNVYSCARVCARIYVVVRRMERKKYRLEREGGGREGGRERGRERQKARENERQATIAGRYHADSGTNPLSPRTSRSTLRSCIFSKRRIVK